MNILVVDDEEQILDLVGRMLRGVGHRVMTTTDPGHAIDAIGRGGVDLLISDVEMPALTGPELVATARRLRPGIPALYMSGTPRLDDCPFLAKPFHVQDLLNAMHKALGLAAFPVKTLGPRRRLRES